MLVYDISRPDTRDTIAKWKKEIEEKVSLPNGAPLPTILLANKADLKTRELDKLEIDAYVCACMRASV
jgi:GTPase SAR1 family protein